MPKEIMSDNQTRFHRITALVVDQRGGIYVPLWIPSRECKVGIVVL